MYFIVIALVSAVLFGVSTPISKYLLTYFNEFQLAGLLYLGAAVGVLPSIIFNRKIHIIKGIDQKNILKIIGAIGFGGILGPVLLLFGLGFAKASSVSLWLNLELVATAILGIVFFKDHLGKNAWIGVFIAVFAGLLLTYHEGNTGIMAILFITFACVCWGFDNHYTALIDGITSTQITFLKGIVAGIVNFTIGIVLQRSLPSYEWLLGAVVLGALSYGVSIVLYINSAQHLGATRSQVIFSSAPFFGFISSWLILSEQLQVIQIIAALLVGFSIWLMINTSHRHNHSHSELYHIHMHIHDDGHHNHMHQGKPTSLRHIHKHKHKKNSHDHLHYPDIHHRHVH